YWPLGPAQPSIPRVMFVDDCASSYMIVATVANSWFTQDPANVTRFGSSYAGHKLLTKSIKKGFDTILKGIPQHTNNRVRAWFILFTFEFSISMDSILAVIFFYFFFFIFIVLFLLNFYLIFFLFLFIIILYY